MQKYIDSKQMLIYNDTVNSYNTICRKTQKCVFEKKEVIYV